MTFFDNTVEKGVTYNYIVIPVTESNGVKSYDTGAYAKGEVKYFSGKVESVSLGNDLELKYKDSAKLNPKIKADIGVKYKVSYKSSDSSIASVDDNGNVYGAKKWGKKTATITCTVTDEFGNSVSDTANVTVGFAWWQWIIGTILFGFIWY